MPTFKTAHMGPVITSGLQQIVCEGYNDIAQDALISATEFFPVLPSDNVLALYDGDYSDCIGFIIWRNFGWNAITVPLFYVEPSSRKQGAFKTLWKALRDHCAVLKIDRVYLDIADANTLAAKIIAKLQGQPDRTTYQIRL